MSEKKKILFLCTGNSCRSQMAEGLCREYRGDLLDAYSAGIETHGLNPRAVKVMEELGIDISDHTSKTVDTFNDVVFDYVVTVCGHAHETCPYFPAKTRVIHKGFEDPPFLTADMVSEEEILSVYRRVRDQIKAFVLDLPDILNS